MRSWNRAAATSRALANHMAFPIRFRYSERRRWVAIAPDRTGGLERSLSRLVVVQPDDELIRICATLRARCERLGHPLGQKVHGADRWIAATAVRLELDLVSEDSAFRDIDALTVPSLPAG